MKQTSQPGGAARRAIYSTSMPRHSEFRVRAENAVRHRWEIAGGMLTAGVGGPLTGRGADVLIIDDPVKNAEEAHSETYRERTWDWYRSVAYTRLEPGGVWS